MNGRSGEDRRNYNGDEEKGFRIYQGPHSDESKCKTPQTENKEVRGKQPQTGFGSRISLKLKSIKFKQVL